MGRDIRVAIAGIGNCASSLVQGVQYYSSYPDASGVITRKIGRYLPSNISFVAAFDIDSRKVGLPLGQAIFAKPNVAKRLTSEAIPDGPTVLPSPILDGVSPHMTSRGDHEGYSPSSDAPVDVTAALRAAKPNVLICYLPVGSETAVRYFAEACLSAGVAFVNCVPVFIASDPLCGKKFFDEGVPIIGDDIRSQVGATILHQRLVELLVERGYSLEATYQINIGGNADFLNMTARDRVISKKLSKTNAVTSRLPAGDTFRDVYAGPSDYVHHLGDTKVAYINLQARGFCGAPLSIETRLSVEDSPNSAAVAIDTIRYAAIAQEKGISGPIKGACSYYMKSPPVLVSDSDALCELRELSKET